MLMLGVDRNAQRMVDEIHRQFDEIPGLKEGKEGVAPEYDKCIDIATKGALRELVPAGLMAIGSTLLVGFVGGVHAIGAFDREYCQRPFACSVYEQCRRSVGQFQEVYRSRARRRKGL